MRNFIQFITLWSDLQSVQLSLPDDPTNITFGSGMNNPVQSVTWFEVVLYANLLSIEQGLTPSYYEDSSFTTIIDETNFNSGSYYCDFDATGYRLPTEGEWERIARAGTTDNPFWIDEPNYTTATCNDCDDSLLHDLESVALFCANSSGSSTGIAGSKPANAWGLKDIHGNVWEWCWDWYSSIYPTTPTINYMGTLSGSTRVIRGGCFYSYPSDCRLAFRDRLTPSHRAFGTGFRLLRIAP